MKRLIMLIPLALVLLLIGLNTVNAQRSDEPVSPQSTYDLPWYTIAGGGGSSSGRSYSLDGTIGQPTAGEVSAGIYTLGGGFWGGGVIVPVQAHYDLFLPLVLK